MHRHPTIAIGIFFQELGAYAYPLSKPKYLRHFLQLDAAIKACGASVRIVRHQSSYFGQGKFSQSWEFQDGEVIETGPTQVDVLFDKGLFATDGSIPVLNCQAINDICTNKYRTFELFRAYCPETQLVRNDTEFNAALNQLPSEWKVVKPIDGLEARNVVVGPNEVLQQQPRTYPLLVQAFIDSRAGIPGIVEGVHDFRVALLNGKIVHSIIRTPPPGKFIASVSQGATLQVLEDLEAIPAAAIALIAAVDRQLARYGQRFYGIDLAFADGEPKIIELNSRVSIWDNDRHPVFAETKRLLAETLVNMAAANPV